MLSCKNLHQWFLKLPYNLHSLIWINNNLFNQLFFHILGQLIIFQKCHSLTRFPFRAFLYSFLFLLSLPECSKFFLHSLHISIILFLFIDKKLFFQFSICIFVIQGNPALLRCFYGLYDSVDLLAYG